MPYVIKELYPDQIFKEWEASGTFGEGGDIIFDNLPLGRPGDVAEDGWMMGEPVQGKQNHWDTNIFGQLDTRRRQPVTRFVAFAFAFEFFWKVKLF